MPDLEHLELTKCDKLTDYALKTIFETNTALRYIDVNKVPTVDYGFLDELTKQKPDLLIRRNCHQDEDYKKDNGLRVPRRVIQEKKKKKKGKGKGKKKK